jgi:hypothetical protein
LARNHFPGRTLLNIIFIKHYSEVSGSTRERLYNLWICARHRSDTFICKKFLKIFKMKLTKLETAPHKNVKIDTTISCYKSFLLLFSVQNCWAKVVLMIHLIGI